MNIEVKKAEARDCVARYVAAQITDGSVVGLGSGDTSRRFVRALAERRLPQVRCVATSVETRSLAEQLGLLVVELSAASLQSLDPFPIDVMVDGADEVDPFLRLIKGGGGALLQEKIVNSCSKQLWVIVDESKLVSRLGETFLLPVEIVPFGAEFTLRRARQKYQGARLRTHADGTPQQTEGGHLILDIPIPEKESAESMYQNLKMMTGVVDVGFFLNEAHRVFVGALDGTVSCQTRSAIS